MGLAMPPITQEQLLENTDKIITIKCFKKINTKLYIFPMLYNSSAKQYDRHCTMDKTVLKYTQNAAIQKYLKHSIEIIGLQK